MLAQESYLNPMGGLTIYMEEVCKRLYEKGHEVTWLGVEPQMQEHYDSKERGYRHVCAMNTLQTRNIGPLFHQMNLMEIYPMLLASMKNDEYDVIQLNDTYMYRPACRIAQRLFKCPYVMGSHLSFAQNTSGEYAKALPEVYQYEFQQELNAWFNARASFTVSERYADILTEKLCLHERPQVIHNGVDIDPLVSAEPDYEARSKYAGDKPFYVYCGRFVDYKGVKLVVEAAERMPDKHFLLISRMTPGIESVYGLAKEVTKKVKELPNLHWEKDMRFDDKWGIMKAADAGIVASLNEEPFGIAALEWMGLGVPLITTALGGMSDFCNENNSDIIKPTADSLIDCLRNHKFNAEKRDNAFETAKRLSWDKTTNELESLLMEVVSGNTGLGSNR